MNKKAFVLMETIVVIVVISVALLSIFASYTKILTKVKTENKYDTSEYIYMTKYVRDYLKGENCVDDDEIFSMNNDVSASSYPIDLFLKGNCSFDTDNQFKLKKIYILKDLNASSNASLAKFDAYMIDYIRKLDVGDKDTILVVEYERIALDDKGEKIRPTKCSDANKENVDGIQICKSLTETYISSLEWDNE